MKIPAEILLVALATALFFEIDRQVPAPTPSPAPRTWMLSAGSRLQVRLTTGVSTATSRAGDPVAALLTVDVAATADPGREAAPPPEMVLPAGSVIRGVVRQAAPFAWSTPQAVLWLEFRELLTPTGSIPLTTLVVNVDNARESVDREGRILGITPPRVEPAGAEESVLLAAVAPEVYDLERAAFRVRELERPDIAYGPGTDIVLETVGPTSGVPVRERRIDSPPDHDLLALAARLPVRTMVGSPPRPGDVINLVFSATDDELGRAMTAAGWNTAVALSLRADVRTIVAVAEDRGYKLGPVSLEAYDGRPPDRVFQKQNNTFDRRHHIRIWRMPQLHQGKPVWAASATHDVGIKFVRQERTFTHRVETDIDLERQKIVDDVRFTGALSRFGMVSRQDVPAKMMNATDDAMTSDGRLAVLVLTGI